jgi:hypothetical protein
VTDIHCTACVMRLEGLEDDLPGVKRIRASKVDRFVKTRNRAWLR